MKTIRFVLISFEDSCPAATAVWEAAEQCADIQLTRADSAHTDLPDHDLIVLAAHSRDFDRARERVASLCVRHEGCAVMVVSDRLDCHQLLALLAAGACDFLLAPFSHDEFAVRIQRALGRLPVNPLEDVRGVANPRLRDFVGSSPVFAKQVARLPTVAGCDAGVLIVGETGTGKEIFAQAIHYLSARASKPWVAVNCGAIPAELIESELFGHVKGAYTTAHASREGLVHEAEGGTLFLDDIDCLPMPAQAKLLRFLQEGEYRQVGANAVRHANVRVIAASNRRLGDLATRGEFRPDLFFRLNVLGLELPSLRARRQDIVALALHFLRESTARASRGNVQISPAGLRKLLDHSWPGNVRELKHVIERAVLMTRGPLIAPEDIEIEGAAEEAPNESFRDAKARAVEKFERDYIERLLVESSGNITQAARIAGKNRRAFWELVRKHRIAPSQYRPYREWAIR